MNNSQRLSAEELAELISSPLKNHAQQVDAGSAADCEHFPEPRGHHHAGFPLQTNFNDVESHTPHSTPQEREVVQDSLNRTPILPWEDLSGLMPKGLNLPMPPALYAKMLWLTNNVPKMSLQKIAKAGAEAEADRLIALHYKA